MRKSVLLAISLSLCFFAKAQEAETFMGYYEQEQGFLGDQPVNSYQIKLKYFPEDNISLNYSLGLKQFLDQDRWQFHCPAGPVFGVPAAGVGVGMTLLGLAKMAVTSDEEEEDYWDDSDGYCACDDPSQPFYNPYDPDCPTAVDQASTDDEGLDGGLMFIGGLGLVAAGVIATLIPEEVEFHLPITRRIKVSPFINPAGLDIGRIPGYDKPKLLYSWGVGSRLGINSIDHNWEVSFTAAYKGVQKIGHGWFLGGTLGIALY